MICDVGEKVCFGFIVENELGVVKFCFLLLIGDQYGGEDLCGDFELVVEEKECVGCVVEFVVCGVGCWIGKYEDGVYYVQDVEGKLDGFVEVVCRFESGLYVVDGGL